MKHNWLHWGQDELLQVSTAQVPAWFQVIGPSALVARVEASIVEQWDRLKQVSFEGVHML